MRLVDEIKLKVCAGKGGDGIESWIRLKYIQKGGPGGGDGGRGGDVYVKAVKDIEALKNYIGLSSLKSEDGKPGQRNNKKGENGKDLILHLPVGSIVSFDDKTYDLKKDGEVHKILSGGRGGFGNTHFKSPRNVRPTGFTEGKKGQCATVHIELHIMADIGLVGLPNAGKSSLINAISNSKSKVGSYPFTTTEPNLAVCCNKVIADIPGLIEGAHHGKGLGIKFLKHIQRTKYIFHLISVESSDIKKDYEIIRNELESFDSELAEKKEFVLLSKIDLRDNVEIEKIAAELKAASGKPVLPISVNDISSLKQVRELIKKI